MLHWTTPSLLCNHLRVLGDDDLYFGQQECWWSPWQISITGSQSVRSDKISGYRTFYVNGMVCHHHLIQFCHIFTQFWKDDRLVCHRIIIDQYDCVHQWSTLTKINYSLCLSQSFRRPERTGRVTDSFAKLPTRFVFWLTMRWGLYRLLGWRERSFWLTA